MDSANSNDQMRPLPVDLYRLYMIFMAVMVVFLSKSKHVPMIKLVKAFKITAILFTINFFAAWFALQENTRDLVVHSNPKAFSVIFYTTMISAPLVLVYTGVHHELIAAKVNDLLV